MYARLNVIEGRFSIEEIRASLGRTIAVSAWTSVTQRQIDAFAGITGDDHWLHTDVSRARAESPFGCTVAPSYLVLALIPQLARQCCDISDARFLISCGVNRARFLSPVPIGGRVRALFKPLELFEIDKGWQLTVEVCLEREESERPACTAELILRCMR